MLTMNRRHKLVLYAALITPNAFLMNYDYLLTTKIWPNVSCPLGSVLSLSPSKTKDALLAFPAALHHLYKSRPAPENINVCNLKTKQSRKGRRGHVCMYLVKASHLLMVTSHCGKPKMLGIQFKGVISRLASPYH